MSPHRLQTSAPCRIRIILTPPQRLLGHVAQLLAALATISVILSWGGVMAFNITHGRAAWGVSLGVLALYPALACLTGSFGVMLIRRPSVIRVSLALVTGALAWVAALASCTTYDAVRATTHVLRRASMKWRTKVATGDYRRSKQK